MGYRYSSDQFYRDWRYAISQSFVSPSGTAFPYGPAGKLGWGDELQCLKFDGPLGTVAASPNGKYIAVAVGLEVHVCDLETRERRVLRGHVSTVDVVTFRPGDRAKVTLVSCAMNDMGRSVPAEPSIVFWDLNATGGEASDGKEGETVPAEPASVSWDLNVAGCGTELSREEIAHVTKHAVRAVVEKLSDHDASLHLSADEQEVLAGEFRPAIEMALVRESVKSNMKIHGRLRAGVDSNVFSPSGRYMIYLPGRSPASNGDEKWDLVVRDVDKMKDVLTLVGHRDAIMWTGYSPDESLIGTVSWDKTMKIWDAGTGEIKFTFETSGQNWTGGFSPDGMMLAGTCGDGTVHLYSLHDGTEVFRSDFGRWCRTLDWSPDGAFVVVGGRGCGKLVLIDVEKQAVVQERLLSTTRSKVEKEEMRRMLEGFLEVQKVKFVDGGRKLVHFTSGDGSAEVFDLEKCCKWRFARTGTDSYPEELTGGEEAADEEEVRSKGGQKMIVWEDNVRGVVMLATVDGDAVRLWSVPLTILP